MFKTLASVIASFAILFTLAACGGGGSKSSTSSTVETRSTTMGQELIDLDKAYNDGIITEKQYNQQKQKILNQKN